MPKKPPVPPKKTDPKPSEPEKKPPQAVESVQAAQIEDDRPLPPREKGTAIPERISLKIIDGKLDTESIRDANATRVKEILRNSFGDDSLRSWVGLTPQMAVQIGTVVEPEDAKFLLDFLAGLECSFLAFKWRMPMAELQKFIFWNEVEHGIVDKRNAQVLTKYLPEELKQSMDWVLALGTLITMSLTKLAMARAFMEAKKKAAPPEPKPEPKPAPAPEPKPPEPKPPEPMAARVLPLPARSSDMVTEFTS